MQRLQVDDQQVKATSLMLGVALDPHAAATALLHDSVAYLISLQEQLWQAVHNVPAVPPDGASPAVVRVRRARQAAAIQNAVEVLRELSRETYPPLPGLPTP